MRVIVNALDNIIPVGMCHVEITMDLVVWSIATGIIKADASFTSTPGSRGAISVMIGVANYGNSVSVNSGHTNDCRLFFDRTFKPHVIAEASKTHAGFKSRGAIWDWVVESTMLILTHSKLSLGSKAYGRIGTLDTMSKEGSISGSLNDSLEIPNLGFGFRGFDLSLCK